MTNYPICVCVCVSVYNRPSVVTISLTGSDRVATVGRNFSLCVSVITRGLNGTAYWLVEGVRVRADPVIMAPVNVETYVPPECLMCSCLKKKYESDLRSGFRSADSSGYAAVLVSFHRRGSQGNLYLDRRYLCDFPDTTEAIVAVESVPVTSDGRMRVELVVADFYDQAVSQSLEVTTGTVPLMGDDGGGVQRMELLHG